MKHEHNQLYNMRHSAEHIMAQAVLNLYPDAKMAMGPATEDGFYGDFEFPENISISPENFKDLEKEMWRLINQNLVFVQKSVSLDEARLIFKNNPYKQEWLDDIAERDENVSLYYTGLNSQDEFVDLCRGNHIASTKEIKSFKLLSVAGAYWRGNSNNKMLVRIYGTAFYSKQELNSYLHMRSEAEKRDHRKLGKELELLHFDQMTPGSPYWLPKGLKIFNLLYNFWSEFHERHGYMEYSAPLLNSKKLWEISGHWEHYREDMFVVNDDSNNVFGLRPMGCPNAMVVFNLKTRSYHDLPWRLSDTDTLYRKEASGALHGLFRSYEFNQDDAHIFLAEDQIEDEYDRIIAIAKYFYDIFGLKCEFKLATRPDNFLGDIVFWDKAEDILKRILNKHFGEGNYGIKEKDGAFYGPKVDIHMKDCMGREWQMGTIQLDFQLPARFNCRYVDNNGNLKTPAVIHRVIYGSLGRFIGILIEHFAGAFPVWIAPVQVRVLHVADKHLAYAKVLKEKLLDSGIRTEVYLKNSTINYQIRESHNMKIPYLIIIGDKEVENNTISVRDRLEKQHNNLSINDFINNVNNVIKTKSLGLWS